MWAARIAVAECMFGRHVCVCRGHVIIRAGRGRKLARVFVPAFPRADVWAVRQTVRLSGHLAGEVGCGGNA